MSRLEEFIDTLEDFELLAFYKYRYNTFLRDSQVKIITEIENRGLNLKDIDVFITNAKNMGIDDDNYCPRCFSSKFYYANETERLYNSYYFIEIKNDFRTCLVCLYSQDKERNKNEKRSFWYRLTKNKES